MTQPIYALTDTWNAGATTFTGIGLNVTDTASAAASLLLDLQVGGSSQFNVRKDGQVSTSGGVVLNAPGNIGLSLGNDLFAIRFGAAGDLFVTRDAANTLAQRNGTAAQAFRVYNTYTDASNYERINIAWVGNVAQIITAQAGTGSARSLGFGVNGGTQWLINTSGNFVASSDNAFDIGASGADRPRNLYMASWIRMAVVTVATLPAAATAGAGARMMVSDATLPVFGSAVVGGGAVTVPVYSTGAAWNVG